MPSGMHRVPSLTLSMPSSRRSSAPQQDHYQSRSTSTTVPRHIIHQWLHPTGSHVGISERVEWSRPAECLSSRAGSVHLIACSNSDLWWHDGIGEFHATSNPNLPANHLVSLLSLTRCLSSSFCFRRLQITSRRHSSRVSSNHPRHQPLLVSFFVGKEDRGLRPCNLINGYIEHFEILFKSLLIIHRTFYMNS